MKSINMGLWDVSKVIFRTCLLSGLLILASCDSVTEPIGGQDELLNPQLGGEGETCVEEGLTAQFPIDVSITQSGNGDQAVDAAVSMGGFFIESCMCRIENFQIVLEGLTPGDIQSITNSQGDAITSFQITTSSRGALLLTINNLADLPDPNLGITIHLAPGAVFSTLHGGGLCIIENVGGAGKFRQIEYGIEHHSPVVGGKGEEKQVYIALP